MLMEFMVEAQQKVDGDWYDDTVLWNEGVWSSLQISAEGMSLITTINKGGGQELH